VFSRGTTAGRGDWASLGYPSYRWPVCICRCTGHFPPGYQTIRWAESAVGVAIINALFSSVETQNKVAKLIFMIG